MIANLVLVALLLLISDTRPPPPPRGAGSRRSRGGARHERPNRPHLWADAAALRRRSSYFTSNWAVFDAEELEQKTENRRPLIAEQQIRRGSITTVDGELVAESLPAGGGRNPVFVRRYPQGSLYGNPRRLQLRRRRSHRHRAVRERPPGRGGERVRDDHRPDPRHDPGGRRRDPDHRRRGAADRHAGTGVGDRGQCARLRRRRRGGRDRAGHRGGTGDGVFAWIRSERTRERGGVRAPQRCSRARHCSIDRRRACIRPARR